MKTLRILLTSFWLLIAPAAPYVPVPAVGLARVGGSTTSGNPGPVTPAKVEKITRLAVWTTTVGWTAKHPESEPKFRAALKGIDALVAEQNWDVVALASALTASGESTFTGPEGKLIVSGTTLLIDALAGDKVDVRKAEYAKSVILGAQAGLRLALGQ